MNSTINANSGAHTFTCDKIIECPFNNINVATIKCKYNSNKDLITRVYQLDTSTPLYLFITSNKIFVRILFALNSCYVLLVEWIFYYFVMCKCMRTTVCINGTVQHISFLVMRLSITITTSCDPGVVIVILAP